GDVDHQSGLQTNGGKRNPHIPSFRFNKLSTDPKVDRARAWGGSGRDRGDDNAGITPAEMCRKNPQFLENWALFPKRPAAGFTESLKNRR
ncbi:MAG: hypothetical protein ACREFL_02510, partial [Stellaceae bacterium]